MSSSSAKPKETRDMDDRSQKIVAVLDDGTEVTEAEVVRSLHKMNAMRNDLSKELRYEVKPLTSLFDIQAVKNMKEEANKIDVNGDNGKE